ncbi:MAG: hypothetical protein ACLTBR_03260 [Anaerostipes sp.]|uniref:hypothetical protein n=1 Tax=Anaerostipes sp. TaxID=1872530 RepID=UPI003994B2A1
MDKIVKVYTDSLNENGIGDFVRCIDCGELMLMQIGGTICRNCISWNLEWVDGEHQECSIEDLKSMGYTVEEI